MREQEQARETFIKIHLLPTEILFQRKVGNKLYFITVEIVPSIWDGALEAVIKRRGRVRTVI